MCCLFLVFRSDLVAWYIMILESFFCYIIESVIGLSVFCFPRLRAVTNDPFARPFQIYVAEDKEAFKNTISSTSLRLLTVLNIPPTKLQTTIKRKQAWVILMKMINH